MAIIFILHLFHVFQYHRFLVTLFEIKDLIFVQALKRNFPKWFNLLKVLLSKSIFPHNQIHKRNGSIKFMNYMCCTINYHQIYDKLYILLFYIVRSSTKKLLNLKIMVYTPNLICMAWTRCRTLQLKINEDSWWTLKLSFFSS
jgi:hypothetical protein